MNHHAIRVGREAQRLPFVTRLTPALLVSGLTKGVRWLRARRRRAVEAVAGRGLRGVAAVTPKPLLKLFDTPRQSRNRLLLGGKQVKEFKELLYQGNSGCRPPGVDSFDLFSCAWHIWQIWHTCSIYINRAPVLKRAPALRAL